MRLLMEYQLKDTLIHLKNDNVKIANKTLFIK